MPITYLRALTAPERTRQTNLHLGVSLAFIAGAINAGGFLAVERYTSHVTGLVSSMADDVALGEWEMASTGVVALLAFIGGAALSAIQINWARRNGSRHVCALPLLTEAALLLVFGILGSLHHIVGTQLLVTVGLLCFVMGLQNAMITKISHAEIRTTHLTGLVTDMGIEIGKLLYWNAGGPGEARVRANQDRLRLQASLVLAFFVGGVAGAIGFKQFGYASTVPLALALALLSSVQLLPPRD
ncbi:YoaK family protein [uncultured Aquabacterium sp.]|uniref:YoaK family protein n=1 Tax=Aquabacterium sp. TaxID=1872578 RepID=UPI002600F735|nr:YoaK family protein [uncultured Aquabacterium sp.]